MDQRRFILFIILSMCVLIGNMAIMSLLNKNKQPPKPVAEQVADEKATDKPDAKNADDKAAADKTAAAEKPDDKNAEKPADAAANEAPEAAPQWFTLGSAEPTASNQYRLLVTLNNTGAAVERIEMSSAHYRDLEDRSGYLGHLAMEDSPGGAKVNVVGAGTPAATAGLMPGDIITAIAGQQVVDAQAVADALKKTEPNQKIELTVSRGGQNQTLSVTLARPPLEVVRPEMFTSKMEIPRPLSVVAENEHDPFSFLLTLWQVGDNKLSPDAAHELDAELDGVKLRNVHWDGKQIDPDTVEFSRELPKFGLKIIKRYQIAKLDAAKPDQPAYHLTLQVEIQNTGSTPRKVAYQLDGPTGLPTEGWWYAYRIARSWGGAGVRDMVMLLRDTEPAMYSPAQVESGKIDPPYRQEDPSSLLVYAGVDAQYFASALLPVPTKERPLWLARIKPILVGTMPHDAHYKTLGDVSCRLVSTTETLEPEKSLVHSYTIFAGPKQPTLLAQYPLQVDERNNLGELIYYGWPIWAMVARPMTQVLQFFYSIVGNYGLAIILLTVLVRGCMFPLSRKQALGAQKMQELKPEMDRINEKYKSKPEEKTRAMQELWRKNNYNPMSGCMVAFLQMPIFLGLYRSLMINVELRQSPLFGDAIHWCSNLAAPDMLFYWKDWSFVPTFLTAYRGFMSLGPYINILPIFTVSLFILQQQMFMPPATDDQTRTQQKMMKYMMIFIGYMYYTVPAGLCLYIISSSLWGIAEKKFLPKTIAKPAGGGGTNEPSKLAKLFATETNGSTAAAAKRERRKQRGR